MCHWVQFMGAGGLMQGFVHAKQALLPTELPPLSTTVADADLKLRVPPEQPPEQRSLTSCHGQFNQKTRWLERG